jgi:hypothetical protein
MAALAAAGMNIGNLVQRFAEYAPVEHLCHVPRATKQMATQKKTLIQLFASLRGIFLRRSRPTPPFPNPDPDAGITEAMRLHRAAGLVPPSAVHLRTQMPTKVKRPINCTGCTRFHGMRYGGTPLICSDHPFGPEQHGCSDWEEPAEEPPCTDKFAWGRTIYEQTLRNIGEAQPQMLNGEFTTLPQDGELQR